MRHKSRAYTIRLKLTPILFVSGNRRVQTQGTGVHGACSRTRRGDSEKRGPKVLIVTSHKCVHSLKCVRLKYESKASFFGFSNLSFQMRYKLHSFEFQETTRRPSEDAFERVYGGFQHHHLKVERDVSNDHIRWRRRTGAGWLPGSFHRRWLQKFSERSTTWITDFSAVESNSNTMAAQFGGKITFTDLLSSKTRFFDISRGLMN